MMYRRIFPIIAWKFKIPYFIDIVVLVTKVLRRWAHAVSAFSILAFTAIVRLFPAAIWRPKIFLYETH